jgi:hypothetical protein
MEFIMKNKIMVLLFFLAALSFFSVQAKAETGRDIMLKVDNRPNGKDRKIVMTMTLINKRNRTRIRSMLLYSRDYGKDTKSVFSFLKPADVKGTGFLVWGYDSIGRDDDRWLYLPALKKVRRISGKSKNDYFMGSDLTYDDMGNRSVDEDTHTLLSEDVVDGHPCWTIQSVPKNKSYMYSKVISVIRKDALMPVKVDFFDRQGHLLKTLERSAIRKHQGFWTAFHTVVKNVQDKHQTVLTIGSVKYNSGLRSSLFRVSTLMRGRLK